MKVPDLLWEDSHPKYDIIHTAQTIQSIEKTFECEEVTAAILMLIVALFDIHEKIPE